MITLLAMILMVLSNSIFCLSVKVLSERELNGFVIIESSVHHTGTDACIRKVTDGTAVYILKQINNPSCDEQFLLVNDAIASTMGISNGIYVNEVAFIPYNVGSTIKMYPERAATLHALVPGNDLAFALPALLSGNFTLHQRVVHPNSLWQKKFSLEVHQQGLTKTIIENMAAHKNLPPIVALDTLVGNSDRSLPNIFYDQQSNQFYGIDQAAAFAKLLPLFATDRLKELVFADYFCARPLNVMHGLRAYRNTLFQLQENVKPAMIVEEMKKLADHLGLNALQNDEVKARLHYHQQVIEQNYSYCLELLNILEQIMA